MHGCPMEYLKWPFQEIYISRERAKRWLKLHLRLIRVEKGLNTFAQV